MIGFWGLLGPIFISFTKVKQKSETHNKLKENLENLSLGFSFYICKYKTTNLQNSGLWLQI